MVKRISTDAVVFVAAEEICYRGSWLTASLRCAMQLDDIRFWASSSVATRRSGTQQTPPGSSFRGSSRTVAGRVLTTSLNNPSCNNVCRRPTSAVYTLGRADWPNSLYGTYDQLNYSHQPATYSANVHKKYALHYHAAKSGASLVKERSVIDPDFRERSLTNGLFPRECSNFFGIEKTLVPAVCL